MDYDKNWQDHVLRANRSCRHKGAVGRFPVVVQQGLAEVETGMTVLDFGAGKGYSGALPFRHDFEERGALYTGHDFGANFSPELHDPEALQRSYQMVLVSNVLNVQGSDEMLEETVATLAKLVARDGFLLANYPASPRYLALTARQMCEVLQRYFVVQWIKKGAAPLWRCTRI